MGDEEKRGTKQMRQQLNVTCTIDVDVPAVFFCSKCHKPFCEECIGRETASKTLCLHCAVVKESQEEESQRASIFSMVKEKKSFLLKLIVVIASLGILFNLYTLYGDMQESNQDEPFEMEISPQINGIADCRANLELIAKEAHSYRKILERPPSSMDELSSMLGDKAGIKDPVSSKPYILRSNDRGEVSVQCPSPEDHGVAGIVATPGKPAQVIYGGGR